MLDDNLLSPGAPPPGSNAPLDVKAAASYVGVSVSFLNRLRCQGGSPLYAKIGRRVVYFTQDLDAWLRASKRSSTSFEAE